MELISKEMQQKFNSNTIEMLEYLKMCIFVDRIINYNKIYKKTVAPMVTSRLHDPLFHSLVINQGSQKISDLDTI